MNVFEANQKLHAFMKKVFAHLNLRDLVKCRATSRQFKFYADQEIAKLDELVVGDRHLFDNCEHWYLTDRRINKNNSIGLNAFASIRSTPFKLDQLKIRSLYIHLGFGDLDNKFLNGFKQLEHLEIEGAARSDKQRTLTLSNLKVLNFGECNHHQNAYVLKTPKLEVLACNQINSIRVEYPTRIKHLECEYRSENCLANFKNLEVLKFRWVVDYLSGDFWKDLKELDLGKRFHRSTKSEYEQFRSSLVNLIGQRAALQREEPKVYLNDVLLITAEQLVDYETITCAPNHFWIQSYQMLRRDSYPAVGMVHFNRLMNLDLELSTDFFVRFPQIKELIATDPVEQDDIEWFLKNASALRTLKLIGTSLDQAFMDRLPSISRRLTRLKVTGVSSLVNNFYFILRFEQLRVFETDRQIGSLELAASAFEKLKKLKNFRFRSGFEYVEIDRFQGDYAMRFSIVEDNQTFSQMKLSWTDLAALYQQRRAARIQTGARIKRARLE